MIPVDSRDRRSVRAHPRGTPLTSRGFLVAEEKVGPGLRDVNVGVKRARPKCPGADADHTGSPAQEALIAFGQVSLPLSMVAVSGIVLWGLRPVETAAASNDVS